VPARSRQQGALAKGSALLALHADVKPAHEDLAALRRVLRAVIASHVGEQGLRAWRVLGGAMGSR
jgi:DNA repair protein RecO (recombination protein O)